MRVYPTGEDQPLLPSFTLLYRQVVENVVYEALPLLQGEVPGGPGFGDGFFLVVHCLK